jgi:prepilin-type N-terminal cleavage/methylation domain-containing protein
MEYKRFIDKKLLQFDCIKRHAKKYAFTLAEVLITLGIIGIIAELTIPTLIQNVQDKAAVASLKKAYSELSQAFTSAINDNGTPDNWGLVPFSNPTGLANLNTIMSKYLKYTKNCGTGTGCFPNVAYKDLNNRTDIITENYEGSTGMTKFALADGTSLAMYTWDSSCNWGWGNAQTLQNICGEINIDINGFKGPNKYGVDLFAFMFGKNGVVAEGGPSQTSYPFSDFCNLSKTSVANSMANGNSCAAWVIYNNNMDYIHCTNLSWSGNHSCQ